LSCSHLTGTKFETELQVRPDDIDMNQHVHMSRYMDYVLAARYDQMERCYKMSMEEFLQHGFGWFVRTGHLEYKRPLGLGERFIVRTWVAEILKDGVKVNFEILKQKTAKLSCDGWFQYTMVNLKTARAEKIPDWIAAKYSV
jgi:YbgC/YbaW family acyl-CoA thioester hydrolase